MSRRRTHAIRAAALAAPAIFLALTITTGCDRSKESGSTGEPPPMNEGAEASDPAPARAGGEGANPHASQGDQGTTNPAGGAPPTAGQGGPQGGMAGGAAPQGEPISDEDLDEFTDAYLEVEKLQGGLEEELRAAESNQEAQEIQQRAMGEIQEAVEATGMDFATYGTIAQRLQRDPELMERVEEALASKRDES